MMHISRLAIVVVVVVAGLSGCSAPTHAHAPAVPTAAAAASGHFDEALAYQSAWHIDGKGKYFHGAIDTCDLNLPISIEDAAALANSNTTVPIFGAVFRDGQISYGTVWPTAVPGTGIVSGTGTYAISYDASGLPVSAVGAAKLKWHDSTKSPAISHRTDQLTLTFTKESRATHCQ